MLGNWDKNQETSEIGNIKDKCDCYLIILTPASSYQQHGGQCNPEQCFLRTPCNESWHSPLVDYYTNKVDGKGHILTVDHYKF